jgi:hypothetical protein
MSKPGAGPTSGISSVDVLIPTERHPACRQREARSGCRTERENLAGDAKGKGTSGSNREAESTDAPERGGLRTRTQFSQLSPVPTYESKPGPIETRLHGTIDRQFPLSASASSRVIRSGRFCVGVCHPARTGSRSKAKVRCRRHLPRHRRLRHRRVVTDRVLGSCHCA